MANEIWVNHDMAKGLVDPLQLAGLTYTGSAKGDTIGVHILRDGIPSAELAGKTVLGYLIRPDQQTVVIPGAVSGNNISVTLPSEAYAYSGRCSLVIRVSDTSGAKIPVFAGYFNIGLTATDETIDPGIPIPSLEDLLAQIDAMEAATNTAQLLIANYEDRMSVAVVKSANLYNLLKRNPGVQLYADGSEHPNANYVLTEYIPVTPGVKYYAGYWIDGNPGSWGTSGQVISIGAFYNANQELISPTVAADVMRTSGAVAPNGAVFFRLSINCGTVTNAFERVVIAAGEMPSEYVGYWELAPDVTRVSMLNSAITDINTEVDEVDGRLTSIEGYGRSAGYIKMPPMGVSNSAGKITDGGIGYTTDGENILMTMQDGTSSSGAFYTVAYWDVSEWKGKGYLLHVDIENANPNSGSKWKLFAVKLSTANTTWTNHIPLTLSSLGLDANASHTSCAIDVDEAWADYDLATYKRFQIIVYIGGSNTNLAGNTITVRVRAKRKSVDYVYADELTGFDQSDYYTKEEISELLPSAHEYKIVFWGDSLTHGAGGDGTTYPKVCAAELGIATTDILNCGVGGENANTIAARQGGSTLIIPAGPINGQYLYTAFVDEFGGSIRPLRQGNGSGTGNRLYIDGQECTLSITQTSSTSEDAVYTIAGYTGSTTAIPKLARFAGSGVNGDVVVIWVGQNGSKVGSDTSYTATIAIVDSMIAHIGHTQYVVINHSTGDNESRADEDAAFLAHYGNRFFPVRKLLVDYGLTIVGIEPTDQDLANIGVGMVPASLRNDGVHMNAYGYTAIGKLLADKIRSLGYV